MVAKNSCLQFKVALGVASVLTPLMFYAHYLIFFYVPNEATMGPVQRIFYFHVGSAVAAYCAIAIVLIASLAFLATRSWKADAIAHAAGEVGFLLCSIVLVTGMIWGKAAWTTWFVWEPRLVSFLLIWLIFLAFLLLRVFGDKNRIGAQSAVLGIIGAITVPIMVYSIELLPQVKQMHPQVVTKGGLESSMKFTMFVAMAIIVVLQFLLVWLRARIEFLGRALEDY